MTVLTLNRPAAGEKIFEPVEKALGGLLLSRSGARSMELPFLAEAAETACKEECRMLAVLNDVCNLLDEDDDEYSFVTETQVKPLHEQQQRSHKKSVKFADFDDVYDIQHITDISDEEINSLYLSADEREAIRLNCRFILHKMDNGDVGFDDTNHCVRGLEIQTLEYIAWRKQIQKQLHAAVFEVQALNSQGIICTPELISKLCQEYSSESVEAAAIYGMYDSIHVVT